MEQILHHDAGHTHTNPDENCQAEPRQAVLEQREPAGIVPSSEKRGEHLADAHAVLTDIAADQKDDQHQSCQRDVQIDSPAERTEFFAC